MKRIIYDKKTGDIEVIESNLWKLKSESFLKGEENGQEL